MESDISWESGDGTEVMQSVDFQDPELIAVSQVSKSQVSARSSLPSSAQDRSTEQRSGAPRHPSNEPQTLKGPNPLGEIGLSTAQRLWSLRPELVSNQASADEKMSASVISQAPTSPPLTSRSTPPRQPQRSRTRGAAQDTSNARGSSRLSSHSSGEGELAGHILDTPSRTLAPERLAQLYETPQVFIFGGGQELDSVLESRPKMVQRVHDLISFCEPLLTTQVKEASIFLAFELPPRSWLQALNELRPDGEILIWLSHWPEGKTGAQLAEGRTSAFFYGEEGLIELAVTLYRLAPFSTEERPYDPWWSEVHLRASLVEVEHFQRLLTQPHVDHYLVTLFAQRMRRWARVAKDPLWIRLAQSSQQLSNYLGQGQHTAGALHFGAPAGASIEEVFHVAEELLCHELLSRSVTHRTAIQVACVTTLRSDHPELGDLLTRFGAEISWFKHPQALLDRISERYFHWCFLTEYVGPWDGFDLAQEARSRAAHLKVSISVFARRTHVLARAEHLNINLLLYPSDYTSYQVITLNRALRTHEGSNSEGQAGLCKRLEVIQEAQSKQGLPQRTGLLLVHTGDDDPWLPHVMQKIEDLRKRYMPKSLAGISLDEHVIAFPLAIDQDEPIKQLLTMIRSDLHPTVQAGAVINQGLRAPESSVADALRRLDWSRIHQRDLTLGWWRSGIENTSGLSAQGAQVLIVDADPTSVDLLCYFCERAGMMVSTLKSGQAAIDLLSRLQYPPQLVIVECTLPYIDGFQVLQACRELPQANPRVVMTSALKQDELIERAFERGATDFVYKPYHMAEVMARVIHALT